MTEDFDVTFGQGPRWSDVDPRKVQGFLQGFDARIKTLCKELKGLGILLEHQSNWIGDLQAERKPQDAAAAPCGTEAEYQTSTFVPSAVSFSIGTDSLKLGRYRLSIDPNWGWKTL